MRTIKFVFAFLLMILATQVSAMSSSSESRDPTFNTFIEADYMPIVADVDTVLIAGFGVQSDEDFTELEDDLFDFNSASVVSIASMAYLDVSALSGGMLAEDIASYAVHSAFDPTGNSDWSGLSGCYIA